MLYEVITNGDGGSDQRYRTDYLLGLMIAGIGKIISPRNNFV